MDVSPQDQTMMRRAIALAHRHLGQTGDNPSVGCVIALDDQVIGEGVTDLGGRPHAEERALAQAGMRARGATAYITLEPCGQRSGEGISCSERLRRAGIARVEIACSDPSKFADGEGIGRLISAGVVVRSGVEAEAAAYLYADYNPVTHK